MNIYLEEIDHQGLSYIDTKDCYSEQHGQQTDALFPNAGLRTYISGNSRLSKLNLWLSGNDKEKIIKDETEEFARRLENLPFGIKNFCFTLYKKLSELYKEQKKKKTKIKLYSYILYLAYKNSGEMVSHQFIAQVLDTNIKTVCKAIKEIDSFIHQNGFQIQFNEDISIEFYIKKLNLPLERIPQIENIYILIKNHIDFVQHRPNSVLGGILSFLFPELERYDISQILNISETTIYQIYKKLDSYLKN